MKARLNPKLSSHADDALRAAFAADVKDCEKLLAKCEVVISANERDGQALAALRTECEALNTGIDPMDPGAVAGLSAKERQVSLLSQRFDSTDDRLDPIAAELRAALLRAADSQRDYLQPVHVAQVEETTAALQIHFGDAARARQYAAESVRVRALTHTLFAHWTQDAAYAPVNCARTVLPQLRAIADGEQPWLTGA